MTARNDLNPKKNKIPPKISEPKKVCFKQHQICSAR